MNKFQRGARAMIILGGLFSLVSFHSDSLAVDDKVHKEKVKAGEVMTFPLSENLIISAETVSPALDEKTGDLIGLSAAGKVAIQLRPKGTEKWIYISCGSLVYELKDDAIILKGRPMVKSGFQVLKSTSDKTFVRISRKTGKWVIKGPHKIELKLK